MVRRALIVGITGQDGSYLAEHLLAEGYEVHGVVRRASSFNTERLTHLYDDPHVDNPRLRLHYGDLLDGTFLHRIVQETEPVEVYNLGAQSHVKVSFELAEYTSDVIALGTVRLLEACRAYVKLGGTLRLYNAATSEMFGAAAPPQREDTPFHPQSPYAVSKLAAYWYCANYRDAYDLYVCSGILFNHESPRRGETFVTRKITRAVGRIKFGLQDKLYLGNLDARRDWGYAADYVRAMWLMMQQERARDFVVATGESHSVREFADAAFSAVGLDWREYVEIDPRYFRPTDVDHLRGDPALARSDLGWEPRVTFTELVNMMVASDLKLAQRERALVDAGL